VDKTLDICRRYTSRIIQRPWPGFVAQKRFGLEQCQFDWVLNIDADEVVTPELRIEIEHTLASDQVTAGYELLRVVNFLGKFWRRGGWYPEYRLRLCRRSVTSWGGDDPHEKALVIGRVRRLRRELLHYTYDDFSNQIRSLNNFASTASETLFKKGVKPSFFAVLTRPVARFFKFYVLRRGFLEGLSGFYVACIEAFYVFLKYVKLWERWNIKERLP